MNVINERVFWTLEKPENGIGVLRIDRPESLNSMNETVMRQLFQKLHEAEEDREIRVLILTGKGKAFVAGADIALMAAYGHDEALAFAELGNNIMRYMMMEMRTPVIAAVNGYAFGGGFELMLACDLRIVAKSAKMGALEINLGILPTWGATQVLSKLVGHTHAKELILTGRQFDAGEADTLGLANRVVEDGELMMAALELARAIAEKSATAVGLAKRVMNRGMGMTLDAGMELEKNGFALCFAGPDQKEGMNAFLEKRKPKFNP